jgi:Fe-Mn family superoxide dismutase
MAPNAGGVPTDIAAVINRDFGSYNNFVASFKTEAKQFGSAWVWLVVDKYGKLKVTSSKSRQSTNEKCTVPGTPILGDLWEIRTISDINTAEEII